MASRKRNEIHDLYFVPPQRDEALLTEVGFGELRLFHSGLWIYGWIAPCLK
jgi:hypothetical protein